MEALFKAIFNAKDWLISLAQEGKNKIWMWLVIALPIILVPVFGVYLSRWQIRDSSDLLIVIMLFALLGFPLGVALLYLFVHPPKWEDPDKEDYQKYMHYH